VTTAEPVSYTKSRPCFQRGMARDAVASATRDAGDIRCEVRIAPFFPGLLIRSCYGCFPVWSAKSEQLARSPQAVSPNDFSAPQKLCSAQGQLARIKLVQLECLIPRADLLFANLCKSACLAVAIFDILPANSGATRIRPDLMKSCGTVFSGIDFFLPIFTVASFGIAFRRVIHLFQSGSLPQS